MTRWKINHSTLCCPLQEIKTAMHGFGASKVLPKWLMRLLVKTGLFGLVCKYFHYARRYTGDVLDSLTKNEKLKLIFSYSFGDFGKILQLLWFFLSRCIVSNWICILCTEK